MRPGVGLVGNTGSYESPHPMIRKFLNFRIRTSAPMAFSFGANFSCASLMAFQFGRSWTDACLSVGRTAFRNRYCVQVCRSWWCSRWQAFEPHVGRISNTYCTPNPAPLIGDDTYRKFLAADAKGQRDMRALMWGPPDEEAACARDTITKLAARQRPSLSEWPAAGLKFHHGKQFQRLRRLYAWSSIANSLRHESVARIYRLGSREPEAYKVARHSLLRRASIPVEVRPIKLGELRACKLYWREQDPLAATDFTYSRFFTPYLAGFAGWALFCDCDFLWLADVAELLAPAIKQRRRSIVCITITVRRRR